MMGGVQPNTGGPLAGLRVIEFAGLGPGPFCAMLLADLGAEVLRIARPGETDELTDLPLLQRGKTIVIVDLKEAASVEAVLIVVSRADVLIEGFRPGVMERLGLGPEPCLRANPRLAYGRMTGWGREGPLADTAGHDLNYIALTGALAAIGLPEAPVPPLNLVGDFGGGALYLAVGLLAAVRAAEHTGMGQVVDAAMIDGAAHLMTAFYGLLATGHWRLDRGANFVDGGAPFYNLYRTRDGRWLSVAAIEPKFYVSLLRGLGLEDLASASQWDRDAWPSLRALLAEAISCRDLDEIMSELVSEDACVAPVLNLAEAPQHPHCRARQVFVEVEGIVQPAPAPRFSGTPAPPLRPMNGGLPVDDLLSRWEVPKPAASLLTKNAWQPNKHQSA